jgi:hypothetical protein
MPLPPPKRAPWNPWPTAIITFFTVAILGFAAFVAFCNLHPTDLVAPDYYEQEVRYQAQIDRVQHARSLSETASVVYDPAHQRIVITLPPAHAGTNPTGQIRLYRPSDAGLDRQLKLEPDASGAQSINAANLRPGLWKVQVLWSSGGREFFMDKSLQVGGTANKPVQQNG